MTDDGRWAFQIARSQEMELQAQVVEGATSVTTGDGKYFFHIDDRFNGMNLVRFHAETIVAGITGTMDIKINNETDGVDMLSTLITINTTERGSDEAAIPAVIDTANDDVATNHANRVDVDAIHSGTAALGLVITLTFQRP